MSLYLKRGINSKYVCSPVTMKRHTDARGVRGHAPPGKF